MGKNKAFTLIELIAVLVILAVISLIVAPLILNIIRRVKDVANKRSVDGYGRAVEYAMASYQLEHLAYPDTFDKLEIEYKGNKVECDTTRINPDHTIYLTKCKVNGKYVKYDKNKDGYYHYGINKMTNIEYVDTYGENLEKALKDYHDEHGEYPSDYTILELPKLDKEVRCDVSINYDGSIGLEKCKVENETVVYGDNNYVYGRAYASTKLLKKVNVEEVKNYSDGNIQEMYTINQQSTLQTPSLTDYRYIGGVPNNFVKFNNELWRIIGIFNTEDGNSNWNNRIKLVRDSSLGDMQLNTSGSNEWVGSSIQVYLNDEYVLDNKSNSLVDTVKYYLGGDRNYPNGDIFYKNERGSYVYSGRNTFWIGRIGLMYPSDYMYMYSLGVDNTCFTNPIGCRNGNPSYGWFYKSSQSFWTMTPYSSTSSDNYYYVSSGSIDRWSADRYYGIYPVLYLKPNVKIKSGDGTIDNPYEFEL